MIRRYFNYILYLFLFIFCIVSISLSSTDFMKKVASGGFGIFSMGSLIFYEIQNFFKENLSSIKELTRIKEQNEVLKKQLDETKVNLKNIEVLQLENRRLKSILGFSTESKFINIPSKIISYDPDNIFDTVIVNKGSDDNVEIDMPVIIYENGKTILFGKVKEVSKKTSKISPVFNENSYVSVKLLSTNYNGLLFSIKNSNLYSKVKIYNIDSLINKDIFIKDEVVTSSISSLYPEGIFIGKVESVEENINKELELNVKLYINFSKIDYVYIIRKI